MKQTIQIINIILATFTTPLATSLLLDWSWITDAWPRYGLVLILMLVEICIGAYALTIIAKKQN